MINKQSKYSSLYNGTTAPRVSDSYQVTYMDTAKVAQIRNDLLKYANEYTVLITKLFNRLKDVPNYTGEWIGEKADYYFKVILQDRTKFLSFGNNLKNIINKLDSDISYVSGNVSKMTRLESEAKYYDKI
jgi:hypothetical protein